MNIRNKINNLNYENLLLNIEEELQKIKRPNLEAVSVQYLLQIE